MVWMVMMTRLDRMGSPHTAISDLHNTYDRNRLVLIMMMVMMMMTVMVTTMIGMVMRRRSDRMGSTYSYQ